MAVATLNIGSLGGSLGLGFWECFIVILVVNVTSDLLPAWTATAGLTGLRMTTFSYAVPITTCFLSLTFGHGLTSSSIIDDTHSDIGATCSLLFSL